MKKVLNLLFLIFGIVLLLLMFAGTYCNDHELITELTKINIIIHWYSEIYLSAAVIYLLYLCWKDR